MATTQSLRRIHEAKIKMKELKAKREEKSEAEKLLSNIRSDPKTLMAYCPVDQIVKELVEIDKEYGTISATLNSKM
jgi:uncharacterized lipoprotein YehR (DUF1307 family)